MDNGVTIEQVNQAIQDALVAREQKNQFDVSPIPSHAHTGSDSLPVDAQYLVGTLAIDHGGTGETTANDALNALLPYQGTSANKFLQTDGNNSSWISIGKFGGTGADGALSISSGTTTINAASAAVVVKNYTSISITGTAQLTLSNPHAGGTILILRSQGPVTITAAAPAINLVGMGATAATTPNYFLGTNRVYGNSAAAGRAGGLIWDLSSFYPTYLGSDSLFQRNLILVPGAAGGAGATGQGGYVGGTGGRGGGALLIECAGAFNFTTSEGINVSGATATNGTSAPFPGTDVCGGGGGGGGGCGMAIVLYNTLTSAGGSIKAAGGAGGGGGTAGDTATNNFTGGNGGGSGSSLESAGKDGAVSDTNDNPQDPGVAGSNGTGGSGGCGGALSLALGTLAAGAGGAAGLNSSKHSFMAKNDWFA